MSKVLSFQEIEDANDVEYAVVEGAYGGGTVRIGSLSSYDIMEWIEANDDKEKRREAGLRLIVKSLVDEAGARIPDADRDRFLGQLRKKDVRSNGKVVAAILSLNGLTRAQPKNDLSEAASVDSPTSSPSPQAT